MQTQFILVRSLPVPTSSSQATYLRFSTISINPLQTLNTPWDPHPCVQDPLRDNLSLNFNSYNPRDNQSFDYN